MEKITNRSLFELKSVTQPVVAGDKAFYVETEISEKDNKYISSIYQVDLKTKERTLFGDTGSVNTQVQLSPDEKKLSYLSNNTKDDKVQLFVMPLHGGAAEQITYEENGISNYHWLKDNHTIYYQTNVNDEPAEEIDENDEKDEIQNKDWPKKKEITKLNYKMDGRGVIPEDRLYQIKKITLSEKEPDLILEENRGLALQYVAKDESYLLYFDRLDPDDEWVYGGSLYKYDMKSHDRTLLTNSVPGGMFSFELANEDEDVLLLAGNTFEYKFVTHDRIYRYDVATDELTNLTPELDFSIGDSLVGDFQQNTGGSELWWLEDGATFLFKTTEHGKITLYKGTLEGEIEKVFDQNIHITGLDLLSNKTQAVVTYSTLTTPSAVALIDLTSGEMEDLYNPNEQFFETHGYSEPERFWYKSVKDWDIQGWYVAPVEKAEKHPAVLYIHGGPQVSYGESFFHEMQALAGAGYGVIMLNPRGGSGYGQEFVASILDNYGDEDYQDLMNGLDYVLEQHAEIDADALYVVGGSYGGFMTNWIVTQTNRFKAAVTQRSISNWISFYGTSDVGPAFVEFQLGRDLSKADELWQMSPLAHAENIETPLLVLHGEEDLRCPLEQGQQMYIAAKKQRVDTRMVTFPSSSHGLSRQGLPNLRIERLDEIVNWLETH